MTRSTSFIREAVVADTPRLLELYSELDEYHRARHPELYPANISRDASKVEQTLADARSGCFVAEVREGDGSAVVGFVRVIYVQTPDGGVLLPRRFALVDELVVTAAQRRTGVGTALLGAAEGWARERGLPALEVTVWEFNEPARELYAAEGFEPVRQYFRKPLTP